MNGAILQGDELRERGPFSDAADVVIIGSGAAGATAARVLSEAGLDVIVIEEGPHIPTSELRSDMYTSMRRLWRDMGFQVAQGKAVTPILQGSCVGGTTAINGAIIHRIPEAIRELWCKEYGAGALLEPATLERVFDQLDEELAVGPAPDAVFGQQNALMEQATAKLGWKGNRIRRNVRNCDGSAHCNQGCPNARRQSMNNSFVPAAVARGARVYATCRAERLLVHGGRAAGVRGRLRDPKSRVLGPQIELYARHAVVLAASAIQSPLFLLDNGLGKQARVGHGLMCHPGTAVAGFFDEPVNQWMGATQGFESTHYWHERMKFETVGMPLELAAVRLPGFGARLMRQMADFGHVAFFGVQVRARARGRVGRGVWGRKSLRYEMESQDVATLKQGVFRLCELMFAAGAREVSPGVHGLPERTNDLNQIQRIFELPNDPRLFHCIAAHLFATAPMGDDERRSVVDPELRVRGIDGLYLTDSSVFPTNMGVNPQHTICALSWLASERLAERVLQSKARDAYVA